MKKLSMWVGPVASEKTTRALLSARNAVRRGHDLVAVRPSQSRRDHEEPGWIVTKGPKKTRLRWPCFEVTVLEEMVAAAAQATAIWIDELMLFEGEDPKITGIEVFNVVQELRLDKKILISSLSATSEMTVFGNAVGMLLSVADRVHWCSADCDECGRAGIASRSWRKAGPKVEQVEVGGEDVYEPLCSTCWGRKMKEVGRGV